MKIYRVGGCVRDKYLKLPEKDQDWVVVGATVKEMLDAGFKQVGKDFPVFLHPENHQEYALARTEKKTGPGYTGFEFQADVSVTLEQDLKRRDLTINAMAETAQGELIDPYDGIQDLEKRLLRHVSPAFNEDPVRILRIARFAARFAGLGFKIAEDTMQLMQQMVDNGEVDSLVAERVWQEMAKALGEAHPQQFIMVLRECGALQRLFPEIDCLFGVPQPKQYHPEIDTGVHILLVMEQAAKLTSDVRVRFAALVHDLGKGITPEDQWPSHINHESRGVPLVKALCKRLKVPNEFRDLAVKVTEYHLHFHRACELKASTLLKMLQALDAFRRPELFELFLLACEADARGRPGYESLDLPQNKLLRDALQAASSITASDIALEGLSGKDIGIKIYEKRISAIKHKRN